MSSPLQLHSLPLLLNMQGAWTRGKGTNRSISMFSSFEVKPAAFSYLIINALNQMVPDTLTSVTPNGVGLITTVAALIFPQSSCEHMSLGSIL